MTYLREGRFCLGDWSVGGIIQINYKMNFKYLRVPSNDCFKSIASHKKCTFSRITFSVDHFSVSCGITLLHFFI